MTAFLLNWPALGIASFVLAAVVAALVWHVFLRRFLSAVGPSGSEALSRSLIGRLGTLHALILALMFAQEMSDYREVRRTVSMEASAINDVYNDLRDYQQESPESAAIIDMLADYVEGHTRWDHVALSEERLSRRTWAAYRRIDETLRDLEPANEHQRDLRTQMLADWESVLGLRNRLQIATNARMPFLFWLVAVSGFFAVLFPCFIYSSSPQNLTMLGMFAAFNGIVLYAIFAIGNPLMGPGAVESTTQLHSLLETMNRP